MACALFVFALTIQAYVPAAYAAAPKVDAKAYVLVDANSGEILYEVNSTQTLVPASMTKLMTMYLTLEGIAEHKIDWTDQVTISDYSNKISRQPSLSSFQLPAGSKYTLRELFYATALNSSNAGAIALAEHIAGTEAAFVAMMNRKARNFGLTDAAFVNSSGLNNADLFGLHPKGTGAREDTRLSARSMAMIAFRLVNDYPEYLEFSSMPQVTIREGEPDQLVINSTNRMLPGRVYAIEGVRGLKTGYTLNAGFCFAGYAQRRSGRFITIVMGASTSEERFRGSGRLLEYGFSVAEGRENRLFEHNHVYLLPDGLNYYDNIKHGANAFLTLGDTGFGKMDNGRSDVLVLHGNLYCISKRGFVTRLSDASGVGSAALTFFTRDGEVALSGERNLAQMEDALLQAVDDAIGASYCFKIEGSIKPVTLSTVGSAGEEYASRGGSGGGVVVGFLNRASDNEILRHGFTYYFLDSDRITSGLLLEADFDEVIVRIDKIEPSGGIFSSGEEIPIVGR
jgi:D-alanyl-D-alanine carboxypeptidase/alpha-acetolactate decarboxylase